MRILHGILLLIMLLFVGLQYDDPDGLQWAVMYLAPVLLLLIAIVRPQTYAELPGKLLRWTVIIGLAMGVLYFWPKTDGFWRQDVWWETETAREGMGMMIAFLVATSTFLARSK